MLNRKSSIIVAAALTAMPALARAAAINFQFDLADITVSPDTKATDFKAPGSYTGTTLTGTAAAPVLTIPQNYYFRVGVDGEALQTGSLAGLGLAQFQLGMTNSGGISSVVLPSGPTTVNSPLSPGASINANFVAEGGGNSDGAGGVSTGGGSAGIYTSLPDNGNPDPANVFYAGSAYQELYGKLRFQSAAATGTINLALTDYTSALQVVNMTAGAVGNSSATFQNRFYSSAAGDTLGALPTLKVIVAATGSSGHPIISLTTGVAAATNYGANVGNLTMTGAGHGNYNVATVAVASQATDSVSATGFTVGDAEVYALKLSGLGSTTDAQVAADITASSPTGGITAVAVANSGAPYATLFSNYDILVTVPAADNTTGSNSLGFDFSQDLTHTGITVTGVAAVPEPATAAGIMLGAAGLLLGRRRKQAVVA